jgi:WD40 repeat protein
MSANNKYLISGSNDKSARIWDLKTMKTLFVLNTECWKVVSVGFTDDSKYCVTGCNDGSVRVWETETGKLVSKWSDEELGIKELCFTKNNQYIFIAPRSKDGQNFGARIILSGLESTVKSASNGNNGGVPASNPLKRQLDSIAAIRPLTKQDSIKYKAILKPSGGATKSQSNGGKLDSAVIYKTPMKGIPVKK